MVIQKQFYDLFMKEYFVTRKILLKRLKIVDEYMFVWYEGKFVQLWFLPH